MEPQIWYSYYMTPKKQAEQLLVELEFLFEKYSQVLRATTQPYLLSRVLNNVKDYQYHPDDSLIRETLIEHVGSLPIVATAFFPYIDDSSVDIGQSLVMLAIHDIGELITGDENTFTKKLSSKQPEYDAGIKLLHQSYHSFYDDVETQTSSSAKFAKAIDKITPDVIDYLTPAEATISRFHHNLGVGPDEIVDVIVKHKRPYMLWNPFMTEFHKLLCDKINQKIKIANI